ncbi:MAG: hypothetical protein GIW99_11130 [Candidatus Eremiobacteraeota bacterium]|nr:hypothetical protein [Candidatus Eremiobacteraeota bacterium]MBC5828213.1 hypothetical protein [Candidatus Eremiobacteraeota bacterium]
MSLKRFVAPLSLFAAMSALSLASCSTSTSIGNVQYTPAHAMLQLAVGTIDDSAGSLTLAATGSAVPGQYLNSVATLRGPSGSSAFPSSGSATLTAPTSATYTTGNLYSYGQTPGTNGVVGLPPTYAVNGNGVGFGTGFLLPSAAGTATFPPVVPGQYTLSVAVPVNGSTIPLTANAVLPANAPVLGPLSVSFVSDGNGGGTVTIASVPGMTEALVAFYADVGASGATPCSALGAEAASLEQTGTTGTLPSGSLSAGTAYCALALGADYPLVEAGAPFSTAASPKLAGAGGTADLSASALFSFTE